MSPKYLTLNVSTHIFFDQIYLWWIFTASLWYVLIIKSSSSLANSSHMFLYSSFWCFMCMLFLFFEFYILFWLLRIDIKTFSDLSNFSSDIVSDETDDRKDNIQKDVDWNLLSFILNAFMMKDWYWHFFISLSRQKSTIYEHLNHIYHKLILSWFIWHLMWYLLVSSIYSLNRKFNSEFVL